MRNDGSVNDNRASMLMITYMRSLAPGINVDISSSGNVAQFNFQLFIQTVIGGLVFLGSAKTVCDLVATMVGTAQVNPPSSALESSQECAQ